MQETQVRSLGQEGPLAKEMVTRSNILAWEIPWTEETSRRRPGRHQEPGASSQQSRHTHTRKSSLDSLVAPGPSDPISLPL